MEKFKNYLYITEFLLIITVLGLLSGIRLISYYADPSGSTNSTEMPAVNADDQTEVDLAHSFFGKKSFINANAAIGRLLDQPLINEVVKLDNGYLLSPISYSSDAVLQNYADSVSALSAYLDDRGTTLVYVSPPYASSKFEPMLSAGIEDYGNDNIDRFLKLLENDDVDCIDIRQCMHDDGINQYDMMYRTDHHWTTEAGLYAYGILEDYIINKTGCIVDERIGDISNYTVTRYEKWHLGSMGQRTGIYYAGIDDFDLITPDFDTYLTDGSGNEGNMQELMLDMTALENRNYTSRYTYDDVLRKTIGDYTNHYSKNDINILFITDSFGKAVMPYLATGFYQVFCMHAENSALVTPEYIENCDPDIVILLYYPDQLTEGKTTFSFSGF